MLNEDERNTAVEILTNARQSISDEKNWTQGVYARDIDGYSVVEMEPTAVCFCSLGAIRKAIPGDDYKGYNNARDSLYETLRGRPHLNVHGFNDHPNTKHSDVLALFDDTIKRLSA